MNLLIIFCVDEKEEFNGCCLRYCEKIFFIGFNFCLFFGDKKFWEEFCNNGGIFDNEG